MDDSRINNKWPLAKEGLPFVLIGCAVTALLFYSGLVLLSVMTGILSLFIIFFFRDPYRDNDTDSKAVLTPADGTVLDIKHIENENNPLGEPAIKVSIFMSIFDVHVNRIPVAGTVRKIMYHPGKFFRANLDKASEYNENNKVILETADSRRIVVIQIAGLIARRIVCWIKVGDQVETGQRFGLIRFGSRLEVYLRFDSRVTAQPRQKVKAGKTVIGYMP